MRIVTLRSHSPANFFLSCGFSRDPPRPTNSFWLPLTAIVILLPVNSFKTVTIPTSVVILYSVSPCIFSPSLLVQECVLSFSHLNECVMLSMDQFRQWVYADLKCLNSFAVPCKLCVSPQYSCR